MQQGLTTNVYRVPAADGEPAKTFNLANIESIEYGSTQRCDIHFSSGQTVNLDRTLGQKVEAAWQTWSEQAQTASAAS